MPTVTGTQNLTIPSSTDNIEDQWLYHGQMALQMEQRFNLHDQDADRLNPRPFAVIDCTVAKDYALNTANQFDRMLKFDTVQVDTGEMTDLAAQPWAITPQETGMYHYCAYAKVLPSLCTGPGAVSMGVSSRGPGTISNGDIGGTYSTEVALTGSTSVCAAGDFTVTVLGSAIGFLLFTFTGGSCNTVVTPVFARLGIYKLRDL